MGQARDTTQDPRAALRERGVDFRFRASTYGAWPDGERIDVSARFGGQASAWLDLDLGRMHGPQGLSMHVRLDQNAGRSPNGEGGALLPSNTMLAFPGSGSRGGDLSAAYLTQTIGDRLSLSVGKLNMVEKAEAVPLAGGAGDGGFLHLGLAAPASGVTPPYLFGAMATWRGDTAIVSAIVYDPTSAVRRDPFDGVFRDGATALGSVTFPVRMAGLPGFHGFKAVASSASGLDFSRLDEAFLPGPALAFVPRTTGIWYAAYAFQQYLWQDPGNPARGWGVFGQFAVSDGNPTFLDRSALLGLSGSSPVAGRPRDRFGIGWFRYSLSDDLVDFLAAGLPLRDETGIEAFYRWAVGPNLGVLLDVQRVRPVTADAGPITTWTLGASVRF